MAIYVGIDIGTVSLKIALIGDESVSKDFKYYSENSNLFYSCKEQIQISDHQFPLLVTKYSRIKGNPVHATRSLLKAIFKRIPLEGFAGIRVCGSGGKLISNLLGVNYENEFRAIARSVGAIYPPIKTIFEIGGQNGKYILLERDQVSDVAGIADYEKSGDCAAGTGSFLDQQASRLKIPVEKIGEMVINTEKFAKIAGRCSVFAKSDMIHAQQKGYSPSEVLKGLCEAIARNFKGSIVKGKVVKKPVILLGGVAMNEGISEAIRDVFKLTHEELFIPELHSWMPAIGAALAERSTTKKTRIYKKQIFQSQSVSENLKFPTSQTLEMDKVRLLRDEVKPRILDKSDRDVSVYLGIDIGSVSTNLVLIDNSGNIIKEIYTRTEGRPIEIVSQCLNGIAAEFGEKINIQGVGTTGSGRELLGELVGADTINDEITAHKTGAEFLARTYLNSQPDTIFEIGGQDSKYISIENGVVVDFAMNEACAAGTGSFLEERAEELDISIKNEFAELALSSKNPVKLGERCTVFMQQDVASFQQRGVSKQDLCAGLAYSVVYNYLNRVVRGRKIGENIFFQGGTAYNDAIACAFAKVLDKEIIVPPFNGVVGAVGAALLARDKIKYTKTSTKFRGFSLEEIDYTLREFTCKACSNYCHMQEFTVEGEKTYWGDQCSDKFRRRQTSEIKPVVPDLLSFRRELFFKNYNPDVEGVYSIGFPRSMYMYEDFPFWNTFFRDLNFQVVLSDESNARTIKSGIEAAVAEPCLPIMAYHGHVSNLIKQKVDWIFTPNYINAKTPFPNVNSYYCPWGQTVPFVVRSSPEFESHAEMFLIPTLRFRLGKKSVEKSLVQTLRPLGIKKSDIHQALQHAYEKQQEFQDEIVKKGKFALQTLLMSGGIGIVLVGRTYNIYDRGLTLDIGNKLRDYYGVNVIPMDFLPVDQVDISDVNTNMYWNYGRKVIAAAKIVGQYPNLHIIYLTNFKCGPDSYIKHYITAASGKPFLALQFDGHGNDAGYITRCEAYLESKGALRLWTKQRISQKNTDVLGVLYK